MSTESREKNSTISSFEGRPRHFQRMYSLHVTVEKTSKSKLLTFFTMISILYGTVILALGITFPMIEVTTGEWGKKTENGVFMVYLYSVATAFLFYCHFFMMDTSQTNQEPQQQMNTGNFVWNTTFLRQQGRSPIPLITQKHIEQQMQKRKKKSGTNFYLRLGALAFCAGHVTYTALEIEYKFLQVKDNCSDSVGTIWTYFFRIFFLVLQTFFIFKHSKPQIQNKKLTFAIMGFSHVIVTNVCVWMRTLINEIRLNINHLDDHVKVKDKNDSLTTAKNSHSNNTNVCIETDWKKEYVNEVVPILFPFVLEYSLIAMATFVVIYLKVAEVLPDYNNSEDEDSSNSETSESGDESDDNKSFNMLDSAAALQHMSTLHHHHHHHHHHQRKSLLDKSHTGLFFGILFVTMMIISIIFFHHYTKRDEGDIAIKIYYASCIVAYFILFLASLVALIQQSKLEHKAEGPNVDDVLLLISLIGALVLESLLAYANVIYLKEKDSNDMYAILATVTAIISMAQSLFQSVSILLGLRVKCIEREDREKKPGRGAVTFLLLGNVAAWAARSFTAKSLNLRRVDDIIGGVTWTIIVNVTLPLLLFFRFHCSVCYAEIWHHVYRHHPLIEQRQPTKKEIRERQRTISSEQPDLQQSSL